MFFMFVNAATHSIMFSYLFLMNFFTRMKNDWQVISGLNIFQMLAIFVHGCQPLFNNPCNYPTVMVWVAAIWGISIMAVFLMTWPWLTKRSERKLLKEIMLEVEKK